MNLDIHRRQRLQQLIDLYSGLLTASQREALALHFDKDWSYAEIAAALGVSRAAVHDQVRRAQAALEEYEGKLGLLARSRRESAGLLRLQRRVEKLQAALGELGGARGVRGGQAPRV